MKEKEGSTKEREKHVPSSETIYKKGCNGSPYRSQRGATGPKRSVSTKIISNKRQKSSDSCFITNG